MSKFIRKSKFIPKKPTNKIPVVKSNNSKLTPNQKMFADEWLKDRNGTRAYKVAYPGAKNDNVAGVLSYQLLRKPKIAMYVGEKLQEISAKAEIDQEWVLKRYKMLSEYSMNDFFDSKNNIRPLNEISKDKLYAMCEFQGLKLPDKKGVLDSLSKHLGMFEKDNEQKRMPSEINVRLVD